MEFVIIKASAYLRAGFVYVRKRHGKIIDNITEEN